MALALQENYALIRGAVLASTSRDPVVIARGVMNEDYISVHGPEHHFLDGASFIAAYVNAGGKADKEKCLTELAERTVKMPGAMCGYWGVCGAAAAVGAALSVIHGTSPLSTDEYYKDNMELTSAAICRMSEIGGARCCKRNAFIALSCGAEFVRRKYGVPMENGDICCDFSPRNTQCIGSRCPFNKIK